MKKNTFIFILFWLLFACETPSSESTYIPPKSEFINSFKRRGVNLSNYVEDQIFVKTSQGDTIQYFFHFIKDGRKNIISTLTDTIFYGKVTRLSDLFLLHNEQKNSHYYVSAIRIDDEIVTGLATEISQRYITDELITQGNFSKLIIDTNTTTYLLRNDKKLGKELFRKVLLKMPSDSILHLSNLEKTEIIKETENNVIKNIETEHLAIKKKYPNPVQDQLTVELFKSITIYQYRILNHVGNIVQKGTLNTTKEIIDCSNLSNGIYYLTIDGKKDKKRIEIKK